MNICPTISKSIPFIIPDDLLEYFKQFGELEYIKLILENSKRKPKKFGYSFILFKDEDSLKNVTELGKFHFINGLEIECKPALLKDELKELQIKNSKKKGLSSKKLRKKNGRVASISQVSTIKDQEAYILKKNFKKSRTLPSYNYMKEESGCMLQEDYGYDEFLGDSNPNQNSFGDIPDAPEDSIDNKARLNSLTSIKENYDDDSNHFNFKKFTLKKANIEICNFSILSHPSLYKMSSDSQKSSSLLFCCPSTVGSSLSSGKARKISVKSSTANNVNNTYQATCRSCTPHDLHLYGNGHPLSLGSQGFCARMEKRDYKILEKSERQFKKDF